MISVDPVRPPTTARANVSWASNPSPMPIASSKQGEDDLYRQDGRCSKAAEFPPPDKNRSHFQKNKNLFDGILISSPNLQIHLFQFFNVSARNSVNRFQDFLSASF